MISPVISARAPETGGTIFPFFLKKYSYGYQD
jgi:hypothetical protein